MLVRDKDGKDIGVVKFMSGRNEAAVKFKRNGGAHIIFVGKDYIKGSADNANDNAHLFPKNWVDGGKLHTPAGVVFDLTEFKPPFRIEA